MTKTISLLCVFIVALNLGCAREGNPYARIQSGYFQVASKSFTPNNGNGPTITLLGAIHVGDKSYYQELQKRLDRADVVLYEDIALSDEERHDVLTNCPEMYDAGGGHTAAAKQLDLTTQTTNITRRAHFVHADVSFTEFLNLKGIRQGPRFCDRLSKPIKTAPGADADQLSKIAPDVKRSVMALVLVKDLSHDPENATEAMKILLFHRNSVALNVLNEMLGKVRSNQNVTIFYGAAHMPDLEKSIINKGYKPADTEWLSAFSL